MISRFLWKVISEETSYKIAGLAYKFHWGYDELMSMPLHEINYWFDKLEEIEETIKEEIDRQKKRR